MKTSELVCVVNAAIPDILTPENYTLLLNKIADFPNYSLHNQILIMLQDNEATQVLGYTSWKALGKEVMPGTKPIQILAKKTLTSYINAGTGEYITYADANKDEIQVGLKSGSILKDMSKFETIPVAVYDIRQTREFNKESRPIGIEKLAEALSKMVDRAVDNTLQDVKDAAYRVVDESLDMTLDISMGEQDIELISRSIKHVIAKRLDLGSQSDIQEITLWGDALNRGHSDSKRIYNNMSLVGQESARILRVLSTYTGDIVRESAETDRDTINDEIAEGILTLMEAVTVYKKLMKDTVL